MSLYQKIKSAITVRQVGEMYGMEPDRHGMVCCPFHSDSDPSMKLNDTYYYCFGCEAARQCHRPAAAQARPDGRAVGRHRLLPAGADRLSRPKDEKTYRV